jgi:hypothetical protein
MALNGQVEPSEFNLRHPDSNDTIPLGCLCVRNKALVPQNLGQIVYVGDVINLGALGDGHEEL